MGLKILGTDIAGILNRALGPITLAGTLHSHSRGARSSTALAGGEVKTFTDSSFRGVSDTLARRTVPLEVQQRARRGVLILGDSISPVAVPKVGDELTIEGSRGQVIWVDRDPDAAAYLCAVVD